MLSIILTLLCVIWVYNNAYSVRRRKSDTVLCQHHINVLIFISNSFFFLRKEPRCRAKPFFHFFFSQRNVYITPQISILVNELLWLTNDSFLAQLITSSLTPNSFMLLIWTLERCIYLTTLTSRIKWCSMSQTCNLTNKLSIYCISWRERFIISFRECKTSYEFCQI